MTASLIQEMAAMQAMADAIANLTPAQRRRVAAWLTAYAADEEVAADADATVEPSEALEDTAPEAEAPSQPVSHPVTFDELIAAVAPKTGAQKAAVAGYWLQATEGRQSWKASEVNKLLKSADVKVSSISIVLTNAVQAKNPLVEELGRLGEGERSRKTFTLTAEGIAYVEDRLA
jgi:hypothetical protein